MSGENVSRRLVAHAMLAVSLLAACSEPEVALPGPPHILDEHHHRLARDAAGPADEQRPGGCLLHHVFAEADGLKISFKCPDISRPVVVVVPRPEPAAQEAKAMTPSAVAEKNSPTPPDGLVEDVAKRFAAASRDWRWSTVGADSAGLVREHIPIHKRAGSVAKHYNEALELYRQGKSTEAFERYVDLARTFPWDGVLGMVVATLASSPLTPEGVADFETAAEATPDDPVAQFVAGVANHYLAHHHTGYRPQKKALYARAIRFLERVTEAYDFEPRVFIYLAVSHFRLGHQAQAEALIDRAISLGADDPDAYYCRAEINQRTNLPRSLDDLDIYLGTMERFIKQGAVASAVKLNRVRDMRNYLLAVHEGREEPEDIFDPLDGSGPVPGGSSTGTGALVWVLGGTGLLLAGLIGFTRRRRRRRQQATPG